VTKKGITCLLCNLLALNANSAHSRPATIVMEPLSHVNNTDLLLPNAVNTGFRILAQYLNANKFFSILFVEHTLPKLRICLRDPITNSSIMVKRYTPATSSEQPVKESKPNTMKPTKTQPKTTAAPVLDFLVLLLLLLTSAFCCETLLQVPSAPAVLAASRALRTIPPPMLPYPTCSNPAAIAALHDAVELFDSDNIFRQPIKGGWEFTPLNSDGTTNETVHLRVGARANMTENTLGQIKRLENDKEKFVQAGRAFEKKHLDNCHSWFSSFFEASRAMDFYHVVVSYEELWKTYEDFKRHATDFGEAGDASRSLDKLDFTLLQMVGVLWVGGLMILVSSRLR
jgi:hypothetical protein